MCASNQYTGCLFILRDGHTANYPPPLISVVRCLQ